MSGPSVHRLERRLKDQPRGLVPYITAGDGGLERTGELLKLCDRPGVAVVELGVPFSDPMADGPVLQAAAQRAIDAGTSLSGILEVLARFREESELPVAIFSYANPLVRMGVARAMAAIAEAGGDAVILPDVPLEEAEPFREAALEAGLCQVLFAAPTTRPARLERIAEQTRGFLYVIGRFGVTGSHTEIGPALDEVLGRVREVAKTPVAVGFGLSTAEQVRRVLERADLAVVGSAFVDRIHRAEDPLAAASDYLDELLSGVGS